MASTYRGHPADPAPATTAEDVQNGYVVPLPSPPPPPSARRMTAPYAGQLPPEFSGPSSVDQTPLDPLPIPLVTPARAEDNPFQKKPSRLRAWLKKPSREFWMRSAVAALAATLGWGVGAKPWKPEPRTPVVARAAAKKPAVTKPTANAVRRVAMATPKPAPASGKASTTVARAKTAYKPTTTTAKVSGKAVAGKPAPAKTTTAVKATAKPKVAASSSTK